MPNETKPANSYQVGGQHYKTSIEHWDYVIANDIPYLEAVIIKYLTRWRKKGGMEDVMKAKHYLDKLIEVEDAKVNSQQSRYPFSTIVDAGVAVEFNMNGNAHTCHRLPFTNMQEMPCGFGASEMAALADLLRQEFNEQADLKK